MNVYWLSSAGLEHSRAEELDDLLLRETGFVWVDIQKVDDSAHKLLAQGFGFHPMAVQACKQPAHLPKIHVYADHIFLILLAPEPGHSGQMHLLELDQFIGQKYLVTVQDLSGSALELDATVRGREVRTVLSRLESGRFRPSTPTELAYTLITAMARNVEQHVTSLTGRVTELERETIHTPTGDPEQKLEIMFRLRHELLTIHTVAAQSRTIFARINRLSARATPIEDRRYFEDLQDQFESIHGLCDAERGYLQGVIDFHQNRLLNKLNVAMERLALITVLLLPVTAIASFYGMNIIVFERTDTSQVGGVVLLICMLTSLIAFWAKRRGWW